MISGGITKFAKAHQGKDFRLMVKEAYDYALRDVPRFSRDLIDGAVGSYFSDHFTRQLKAASMVQDYLGLCPKPSKRVDRRALLPVRVGSRGVGAHELLPGLRV